MAMPQEGEIQKIEQPANRSESSIENPASGAAFESRPAPSAEKPAVPVVMMPAQVVPAPVTGRKDQTMLDVEQVLEEGLAEAYAKMDPKLQRKFREDGDAVAKTVAEMVRQAKVRAREVLALIAAWLKIIPGVSRFFIDQEAKIKTDKIVRLGSKTKLP